ncbi:hypothetical protein [Methanobrevibacter sp.]|nr:hypothetical protein [Methanobrevibacter sp.]
MVPHYIYAHQFLFANPQHMHPPGRRGYGGELASLKQWGCFIKKT